LINNKIVTFALNSL